MREGKDGCDAISCQSGGSSPIRSTNSDTRLYQVITRVGVSGVAVSLVEVWLSSKSA